MSKRMELLKKLEYFVAFQVECLKEGNWEDYDRAEERIRELEHKIIGENNEEENSAPI